jgi:hypothetical protein
MTRNSNPGGSAVVLSHDETTSQDGDPSGEFQRFENLAGKLVQVGKDSPSKSKE